MGLISKLFSGGGIKAIGQVATGVAEVFMPSSTRKMELSAKAQMSALEQMGSEYKYAGTSFFDRFVNGLNRLPRPLLAIGTVGLFIFAMVDPFIFSQRMEGLNHIPEPLWWLLGAIVAFYFGARETYYFRHSRAERDRPKLSLDHKDKDEKKPETNPVLEDWHRSR